MGTPFIIADLDGTMLHDAEVFEDRALSQRTIDTVDLLHAKGIKFAVATARPVSTGLAIVQQLHADAAIYLNGALIDYDPKVSDFDSLTGKREDPRISIDKIGFPSARAAQICLSFLKEFPDLEIGIVMDDVRYTNFDVKKYWTTQDFQYTDFTDVPEGTADKIIIFPGEGTDREQLASLIPSDMVLHVSEGRLWMLMTPLANKEHAARLLAEKWNVSLKDAIAFGDDIIDIPIMKACGTGVAVANGNAKVLEIADEVCPSNNEDGVAQWMEERLL